MKLLERETGKRQSQAPNAFLLGLFHHNAGSVKRRLQVHMQSVKGRNSESHILSVLTLSTPPSVFLSFLVIENVFFGVSLRTTPTLSFFQEFFVTSLLFHFDLSKLISNQSS